MTKGLDVFLEGKAYLDGAPLFDSLRLDLKAGEWTCLLGGSGVGKTTILRFLADLPSGAKFDGQIEPSGLANRIAYMAQDDLLMPWANVAQNVALGARLRGQSPDKKAVSALLERVGLEDHAAKLPSELSGGQKQRAALARTLMENKPVILLDEPFSALDARTRARMQDLAVELLAGRTVLIVTHDPGEAARLGHAVYVLSKDRLDRIEPPTALIPRDAGHLETLQFQAALFDLLMDKAA